MATTEPVVDGRTARAQRTREAVVDALLGLIEEGDLRPTAPRIAERAGVSLRSIFQHFNDLESLFAAVGARQLERMLELAQDRVPDSGPLEPRLDAFVAQRTRLLEAITPVRRASLVQEPFSPQLQRHRDRAHRWGRDEVARVFGPELDACAPPARADALHALDALSSWSTWDLLRQQGALDIADAQRVLTTMLRCLIEGIRP